MIIWLIDWIVYMLEIGAFEAKNRLPELMRRVERGERILITHRGKPAAMLVPPHPLQKDTSKAIDDLLAFGETCTLDLSEGETLRDLIDKGRK